MIHRKDVNGGRFKSTDAEITTLWIGENLVKGQKEERKALGRWVWSWWGHLRELLLDDCSVFALERDKIIIAPENPGDGGGWVGVLEVGEITASPSNS